MIKIQNFNFIIGKFLQMPKLLYNVLKISRGANPPNTPPLVARLSSIEKSCPKSVIHLSEKIDCIPCH